MIECYLKNVTVGENEPLTWSNTTLKKGRTVEVNGATIQFNKCGIYELTADTSAVSSTATSSAPVDLSIQLMKDGVAQPQAVAVNTAVDTTSKHHLSFTTLVQVAESNSCSPCSSPTTCTIVNNGGAVTLENANVVVTKII